MSTSATLAQRSADNDVDQFAATFLSLQEAAASAYKDAWAKDELFERSRFSLIGLMYRFASPDSDGSLVLQGDRFKAVLIFGAGAGATPILSVS